MLTVYVERTSFIWSEISKRKIPKKNIDLLILGDSQITSGISPTHLKKELQKLKKDFHFFYYPRPSEQPEGMLILTREFRKTFDFKYLVLNISPVTTSKNLISESHKSLFQNFSPFSTEPLKDFDMGKFYFKNISGYCYYFFLQGFPLLKLNSNLSKEMEIVKSRTLDKKLKDTVEAPIFSEWENNFQKNIFLKNLFIQSEFYWEWGNFSKSQNICIPKKSPPGLPAGVESAFLNLRKEALISWEKIAVENRDKKIFLIYLQFSPFAEEKIGSKLKNSPIQVSLNALKRFSNIELLTVPKNFFSSEDFADFTHLNFCGMEKFTKFLSERLQRERSL
ncbi:MAG: hypothetical protein HS129_01145 [Leptospiraceae bacterium]|nr:hypothetical protein [Leptospiraceae bacterium]